MGSTRTGFAVPNGTPVEKIPKPLTGKPRNGGGGRKESDVWEGGTLSPSPVVEVEMPSTTNDAIKKSLVRTVFGKLEERLDEITDVSERAKRKPIARRLRQCTRK